YSQHPIMAEPVGLAASLITLAGLAVSSSKLLHEVSEDLKNAPKEITQLQRLLHGWDSIRNELESRRQELDSTDVPIATKELSSALASELRNDLEELQSKLKAIKRHTAGNQ